jgi:rare lipoprotein A
MVLAAALQGCAETKLAAHTAKQLGQPSGGAAGASIAGRGIYKVGEPYQISGVWYYPAEDWSYDETGIASWYGPGFHEKVTANGETYDQDDLTAAHRTLPMPSFVRVTNLENGRSIVVRINDRGPFARGRIIDMSRRGAQLLGFDGQGTARVRVQILVEESRQIAEQFKQRGGTTVAAAAGPRTPVAVAAVPPPVPRPHPTAGAPPPLAPTTPAPPGFRQLQPTATRIYVQAGAFESEANARGLAQSLRPMGATSVSAATVNGRRFWRVRVGPIASVDEADRTLERVVGAGQTAARLVVD